MINSEQINALYQLYPQVVKTVGDEAFDADGNQVQYDLIAVTEQAQKNQCKEQASALLYKTDWTTIPDVADPANSPYLTNQTDFIVWRSQIRVLAINPVTDPVFPPKPDEVWG
jgi:hypothetical protein